MISNALRTEIERWAARRDSNPVFEMARNGTFTPSMVTQYIANVTYMITLTPGHLRYARDTARALGDERLALHYEHKFDEEVGHHKWGQNDLESLTRQVARPMLSLTPSMKELAAHLPKIIERDPAQYLCYLAFTEHITVLLGDELLDLIESGCGVPRSSMTIVDNHIEVDREHAEEGWGCIDDLVGDPRRLAPMRNALLEILAFYDRFCVDLTTANGTGMELTQDVLASNVSAA